MRLAVETRTPARSSSRGLLEDGAPVAGSIWVPVGPWLAPGVYHARTGGRAWFDDQPIHNPKDLYSTMEKHKIGDAIKVTVERDGQRRDVTLTLGSIE